MKKSTISLLIILILFSCKEVKKIPNEIAEIPVNLDILRFEKEFSASDPKDLPELKARYPYFFPEQYPDSVWKLKLTDTLQQQLLQEVDRTFGNFGSEEADLVHFYQHLIYYFPDLKKTPTVVTMTTDVDYSNRVILADTFLLLGLDNFLGPDHKFYAGIDRYIANHLDKKYLMRDIALAYTRQLVPPPEDRSFLAQMIYQGKRLHVARLLLPTHSEDRIMAYSEDQLAWARANEDPIWRYFIEGEMLYETDRELPRRFIDDAPFSKFRLELDRESPGRIGRYIGWQIVEAYVRNNETTLPELLALQEKELFLQSKFKPRK